MQYFSDNQIRRFFNGVLVYRGLTQVEIAKKISEGADRSYVQSIRAQGLTKPEGSLLEKLIGITSVKAGKEGGHDLSKPLKSTANRTLSDKTGLSLESVRRAKERLHARGIITVDGMTWDEYLVENDDGQKRRPLVVREQIVAFTKDFVTFIKEVLSLNSKEKDVPYRLRAKKIALGMKFPFCQGFASKFKILAQKSAEALQRYNDRKQGKDIPLRLASKQLDKPIQKSFVRQSLILFGFIQKNSLQKLYKAKDVTEIFKNASRSLFVTLLESGASEAAIIKILAAQCFRQDFALSDESAHALVREILKGLLKDKQRMRA